MNRRDWLRRVAYGAAAAPLFTESRSLLAQGSRPSRSYRYIHLDVFTDRGLAGNQLLVYVNPEGLDADAMARLTRESNYSENTFVFPAEQRETEAADLVRGLRAWHRAHANRSRVEGERSGLCVDDAAEADVWQVDD